MSINDRKKFALNKRKIMKLYKNYDIIKKISCLLF